MKYLDLALKNAPQTIDLNNINLLIKLNLYIAQMQSELQLPHLSLKNLWKNINSALLSISSNMNISLLQMKHQKVKKLMKYLCINLELMMQNFVFLDSLELAAEAGKLLKWLVESFFSEEDNFHVVSTRPGFFQSLELHQYHQ